MNAWQRFVLVAGSVAFIVVGANASRHVSDARGTDIPEVVVGLLVVGAVTMVLFFAVKSTSESPRTPAPPSHKKNPPTSSGLF